MKTGMTIAAIIVLFLLILAYAASGCPSMLKVKPPASAIATSAASTTPPEARYPDPNPTDKPIDMRGDTSGGGDGAMRSRGGPNQAGAYLNQQYGRPLVSVYFSTDAQSMWGRNQSQIIQANSNTVEFDLAPAEYGLGDLDKAVNWRSLDVYNVDGSGNVPMVSYIGDEQYGSWTVARFQIIFNGRGQYLIRDNARINCVEDEQLANGDDPRTFWLIEY